MNRPIIDCIILIFVVLWFYSVYCKLSNWKKYKRALMSQIFPRILNKPLLVLIPFYELSSATLLIIKKTTLKGMILSFALMLIITIFVIFHLRYPYSIGGLFDKINWPTSLRLSILLTLISLAGVIFIILET